MHILNKDKTMIHGIRGAITVDANTREDILLETKNLLFAMIKQNEIVAENIVSVIFTVTDDLNAAFPATAAREIGWLTVPLICAKEIAVPDSLPNVIRVLLTLNTEKSQSDINHIYLKGATSLRDDLQEGRD